MSSSKLLDKALAALFRTVECTTEPKHAVQILRQHFTCSRHELVDMFRDSYEQALTAISIGLGQPAPLVTAQIVKEVAQEVQKSWELFTHRQPVVAEFNKMQAISHCQALAKLKEQVFVDAEQRPLTETELASVLTDSGSLAITQLLLAQWQALPAAHLHIDSTFLAFLQQDELLGRAVREFFQEQMRRDPRVATTLQMLETQGLAQNILELKQLFQQLMVQQQVAAEIKPQDEMATQRTSESLRLIDQAVQKLKRLPANHPEYGQLANQGASLRSSAGELVEAADLLQQAKKAAISDAEQALQALAAFNLFQVQLRRGKTFYSDALRELHEAIQLNQERYALHDVEKYPIIRILGAGGMGCVFLCSSRLHKEVVVKCFWDKQCHRNKHSEVAEVFKEAFAMRDIAGEYVPKPLDYGCMGQRQRAFFVTEYLDGAVDGETWLETQGKLTAEVGWQVGWQIAKGLQLAHQRGVLHLDLKPANILLLSQGSQVKIKLIDFGLSQLAASLQQQMVTRQGQTQLSTLGQKMFGTLEYAAPEQSGYQQYGKPSEKSDVFSYGQTMKELLSKTKPRLCQERDLPEQWRKLLFDCTRAAPAERPTVAEILTQLETWHESPLPVPPSTQPKSSEKPPEPPSIPEGESSKRKFMGIAVAVLAIVVVIIGLVILPSIPESPTKPESLKKKGTPQPPHHEPPSEKVIEMVTIPAGQFRMGDIQGTAIEPDEGPVHLVSIKEFAISRYEVTFEEYDYFAERTGREKPIDEGWGRGKHPVINVSWEAATAYAKWLSQQTGNKYRLPTEAEWEYAARAKTETDYWWGNEIGKNRANCYGCGSQWDYNGTAPVGSFSANPYGLYDTAGNVSEWTCSTYERKYNGKELECASPDDGRPHVRRGGALTNYALGLRTSYRVKDGHMFRHNDVGFRLVQEVTFKR